MNADATWRALRVRLFLEGHPFEYIDGLPITDLGDITAYYSAKSKAEDKARRKSAKRR